MTNNLSAGIASTWNKLPNPPRTEGHPDCIQVLNDGKMVCTFSGRRNPGGAFTNSSGVFLYDPVANTWADKSDPGMDYWTKDLIIDLTDATQNTWYVCVFSGWGGAPNGIGGLYKTSNRGTTWTKLTAALFDRVTSITFNPQNTSEAYLTTETQGLWMSTNMNASTPTWTLVNSYPFRQPERVYFNPYDQNEMWVSSFGNGLKKGLLASSTGLHDLSGENKFVSVYPNPFIDSFTLRIELPAGEKGGIKIINLLGEELFSDEIKNGSGIYNKTIQADILPAGIYFILVNTEDKNLVRKIVKQE